MSIERARLLLRVANQLSDDSDRRSLLAWADEILANSQNEAITTEPSGLSFPISVFRRYKGKLYNGKFLKNRKIEMNGKQYSPSAAAGQISGHLENGWKVWRYVDASNNEEHPIDRLRDS